MSESIWQDIARRVEERGVRVEQRLTLLETLEKAVTEGQDVASVLAELVGEKQQQLDATAHLLRGELR